MEFDDAWPNKKPAHYDGISIFVIGRDDLIRDKRAAGRQRDLDDVAALEKIGPLDQ